LIRHRRERRQYRQAAQRQRAGALSLPPAQFQQRHHGGQHHGILFGKGAAHRGQHQSAQPDPAPRAVAFGAFQVHPQTAQHGQAGKQVGAPGDVGDRFGEHRVHRPESRRREGLPARLP
jgi:hypothetical protein